MGTMARRIGWASAIAVLIFFAPGVARAGGFSDVAADSPYASYIDDVQAKGITDGIGGGKFGPEQPVTRAAFAKFAVDAFHLDPYAGSVPFTDIAGHWAKDYIAAAYHAGIVSGKTAAQFAPDEPVTREEAAAMIWRCLQAFGEPSKAEDAALDEPVAAWAQEAVKNVVAYRLYGPDAQITAAGGVQYRPKQTMSRQEMAVLLDLSTDLAFDKQAAGQRPEDMQPADPAAVDSAPTWQEQLKAHMENQDATFAIQLDDPAVFDDIKPELNAILDADDYLHYIFSGYRYELAGSTVRFELTYFETKQQTDYVTVKARQIVDSIIKPGMNDVQKEKAVHDYIVAHVIYDDSEKRGNAYDALVEGKTVCQGYALLTYRMLTDAGIENRIAEGTADGISHAWNVVKIDGNWYDLDTTWDDPVPDQPGRVLYHYFNLTDDQLKQNHEWTLTYPQAQTDFASWMREKASSGAADVAVYAELMKEMGLEAEKAELTADYDAAMQTLLNQELDAKKTAFTLRFKTTEDEAEALIKRLCDQGTMWQYGVKTVKYSYRQDTRAPDYFIFDFTTEYR